MLRVGRMHRAFTGEQVVQDLAPNAKIVCFTIILDLILVICNKWSFRLAADKKKTKRKKTYGQTGPEKNGVLSLYLAKLDSQSFLKC